MDQVNLLDCEKSCRTCLSQCSEVEYIYNTNFTRISLANMIMSFTSVVVSKQLYTCNNALKTIKLSYTYSI